MTDETIVENPRPRRRRATSPAGSPAAVTATGPSTVPTTELPPVATAVDQPVATAVDQPVDAPADKPAAKRRSRRAVAEVAAEVDTAQPAIEAPEPSPAPRARRSRATVTEATAETDETPAAPARRRSAAGRKKAPAGEAPTATPEAGEVATEAAREPLDVLAELGGRPGAVVFQAPARRRAGAPAGPPRAAQSPSDAPADDSEADASAEAGEPTVARPGRRRSRGRAGAAESPAGPAAADEAEDAEDAEGTALTDETDLLDDADEDEDGEPHDGDEIEDGEPREGTRRRRRRRGGRGRRRSGSADVADTDSDAGESSGAPEAADDIADDAEDGDEIEDGEPREGSRRRRRRRRSGSGRGEPEQRRDEVTALKGSTRLEAKRQRRREGRDAGRRRAVLTEAEFLARRESVERAMVVREAGGRVQIAVLEDGVLVEHFVSHAGGGQGPSSMIGNVYLGRVQNVLPSMEAAFVDIGKGRNAVLYAGEVNWDAAGLEGQPRRIEQALKSGDSVLVQVTKDPIGHKGARLTSQVTLAGRYLVYVPAGGMTGISRKLPENERTRLKKLLKEIVPDGAGVIVRTAAEGAAEDELRRDVKRLQDQWAAIEKKMKTGSAPTLLQGEPDLAIRVVRDIFNDDFSSLVVQGDGVWTMIGEYVGAMAPDLASRVSRWTEDRDVFAAHRIDEQLAKGMDRKVWLPSGGSLVIDRTEAMTVIDVNTGKFTGSGGTLEETVTRNNLEAAEEIVRQLRLRDIGGMIVVDFIDMVLESNRDLVLRRLVECLGRDRTKHQVAEVTSLGLVQMTRKRVGQGLVESFSETCQHCNGRGFLVRTDPVETRASEDSDTPETKRSRRKRPAAVATSTPVPVLPEAREAVKATLATIAAAAAHAHEHTHEPDAAQPAVPVEPESMPESAPESGIETAAEHTGESAAPAVPEPAEQDPSDGI